MKYYQISCKKRANAMESLTAARIISISRKQQKHVNYG